MSTVELELDLVVGADGVARCIYNEALELRELGRLTIKRASPAMLSPIMTATGGRIWGLLVGLYWGLMRAGRKLWWRSGGGSSGAFDPMTSSPD